VEYPASSRGGCQRGRACALHAKGPSLLQCFFARARQQSIRCRRMESASGPTPGDTGEATSPRSGCVRVSAFSSLGRYGHMAEAKQVVERHVEAFNAHQADAEPWTDDAEFVAPGASMRGREEVLAFLAAFWEACPDGRLELSRSSARAPSPQLRGGSLARTAASSARPLPRWPPVGSSTSAGCPLTRPAATSSLRSICTSIKWSSSPSSASCRSCQRPSTARPNRVPTEGRHVPAFPATSTVRSGAPPVATRSRQ
jgi:hypothetical protein